MYNVFKDFISWDLNFFSNALISVNKVFFKKNTVILVELVYSSL